MSFKSNSVPPRINRNIVECKDTNKIIHNVLAFRINRNIVECKDRANEESGDRRRVLIETLWNVKIKFAVICCAVSRINRNIVECKVSTVYSPKMRSPVLIETLWNVKSSHFRIRLGGGLVLIETLWNVKFAMLIG